MARKLSRIPTVVLLGLPALFLGGVSLLLTFLARDGGVLLSNLAYYLMQLLGAVLPALSVGPALALLASRRMREGVSLLAWGTLAVFLYVTLAAFLDSLILYGNEAGDALLYALLSGLVSLGIEGVLLLSMLAAIPFLLFLRGGADCAPRCFSASALTHASLASAILYAVFLIGQESASFLSFLAECFWIANANEIVTFVISLAVSLLRAAVFYLLLIPGARHAHLHGTGYTRLFIPIKTNS